MKRTLIFSSFMAIGLFAGGIAKGQSKDQAKDVEAGKLLISKSDCLACHKQEGKLVGPAYADIAKKYKPTDANIALLAGKVIKGGTGVWGQIPMAAHPALAQADAKKMIKYILSLTPPKK